MYPTLSKKYYDKKYLIAGDKNAKHTIVIFSDPLCPNCIDTMPELIRNVKKNPLLVSLYYIHMPLDMHPTAKLIVKATMIAKRQDIKDIDYKVYTANFEDNFDPYKEKNKKKVLDIFNKKFNTKITMKQIDSEELNKEIKYDLKLADDALVQGTPTIFFDGMIDSMRNKYLKYLK
jgi:protein-disulfide isomerase